MTEHSVSMLELRRRTLVAFSLLAVGLAATVVVFMMILNAAPREGDTVPAPLRSVLNFNGRLGGKALSATKTDHARFTPVRKKEARANGDIGLDEPIDLAAWRLEVSSAEKPSRETSAQEQTLTLNELKALPKTEVNIQFKCIEGWSEVMSFGGVRFRDFMSRYHVGTKSGRDFDEAHPEDLYRYVGLATPDEEYYVSIDMKSVLNDDTLLAYEQNGEPLSEKHGAPLRLYIPNKYGVKSLKRIGKITFSDRRPADYWAEQGYDWFVGL